MKNQPKHSVKAKTFKNRNRLFLFAVGLLFLILHLWAFSAPVCAQTISSADNQSFSVGDAATAIETITITDDAVTPTIKKNKDLRIRIPSSFNMTWDTSVTTVTLGGSAAGDVNATLKAYEDGDQTLVLDVKKDFAAGDTLTILGPRFTDFLAPSTAANLELDVDDDTVADAADDKTITIESIIASISSAANQIFEIGDAATAISTITITDASQAATITAAKDIRVRIPGDFNMVWDSSDTTATIGGGASGKVSTTVSYEDSDKTLVIAVSTDFAAGDQITVAGLGFKDFTAQSFSDKLDLEVNNDGAATATDGKLIRVIDPDEAAKDINPVASPEYVVSGSLVIPMDNDQQDEDGSEFNIRAYGLVNRLLWGHIPVKWAIKADKAKDGVDFSAEAKRLYPSAVAAATLDFRAGPFIISEPYAAAAKTIIEAFDNDVAVYELTEDATVDIRYTLNHKPKVGALDDGGKAEIHTDILSAAGFVSGTHYNVITAATLTTINADACYTFVSEPHFKNENVDTEAEAIRSFVESGGNFLAQCEALVTYENNTSYGHFQTTNGVEKDNLTNANLLYGSPDISYSQFQGDIDGTAGGSVQDYLLAAGSSFQNDGHIHVNNNDPNTDHFVATASKLTGGAGSNVYYLGGHNYSGTTLEQINGQRIYLNAVLTPSARPASCNLSFPTAVGLISFTATGKDGSVRVDWQTAHEIGNMGFYLYRSESRAGPFIKLTERLIPGAAFSSIGMQYEYLDTDVIQGKLYYYRLVDVDTSGTWTYHGPICVDWDGDGLPDDWELAHGLGPTVDDAGLDADNDGLTNLEEYARGSDPNNPDSDGDGIIDGDEHFQSAHTDPGGSLSLSRGVHVLASDETGITLELRTEAFEAATVQVGAQQFEKLSIKEYVHGFTAEVGKPQLPLKGILLDIPAGQSAQVTVLDSTSTIGYGYQVYPVPQNFTDEQSYNVQVAELFTMDADAYGQDAFYPKSVAGLGEVYNFREQLKQQLIFYPVSFNPVSGQIRHYTRIRVRVDYVDAQLAKAPAAGPHPWVPPSGNKILNHPLSMGPSAMAFIGPAFLNSPIISAIASLGMLGQVAWMPPEFDWSTQGPAYKILIAQAGIYRLTGSYLEASGVNLTGVDIGRVRLYNLGWEIALTVHDDNDDNLFDSNDYIEFYATAVASGYAKYTNHNVYWLTLEGGIGAPLRMEVINGAPAAGPDTNTHEFTVHYEPDQVYWQEAPGADSLDRWFIGAIALGDQIESANAGQPVSFDLPIVDVVDDSKTGTLKILMYGRYDTDHEVRVSYEGEDLDTFTWSGSTEYEVIIEDVDFSEKTGDSKYTVSVTCLSGFDRIAFDWIEATYPREFAAANDSLKFTHDSGYLFAIDDFNTDALMVFDITATDEVMRVQGFDIYEPVASSFSLEFEIPGDGQTRTYLVLAETEVNTTAAAVVEDSASDIGDSANGADYILITHQDIGWDVSGQLQTWVDDLVTLREAQGLRVKLVNVQDIYDEFSYGLVTPQAIKDFLTYAYENWSAPAPQYVLLVGDSSYDYKDNWGLGTINYVPSYLIYTEFMGETVTDEWFVTVNGDDAAADLYIGRLPAESAAETQVMVDKIIAYETGPNTKTWEKNILLVADDQEEEFESVFKTMNEDAAALLPTGMNPASKGYLQDYLDAGFSPLDLNSDILDQITAGALIANFSGHGHLQGWASPSIFDAGDIDALANTGKYPFIVSMNCLTGYFAYPDPDVRAYSFAELLLRAKEKGTAAALMPTGMTTTEGQHVLNTALFETIFVEDVRRLGPAIARAKRELLANGDAYFEQVSETFLLFGDPAMQLRVPLPRRPSGLAPAFWTKRGVALRWGAALDCNNDPVAGYNVYRSTSPAGNFTKINQAAITEEEYTDDTASATAAAAPAIYYYTVTAVDTDGDESIPSAMVASPSLAGLTGSGSGGGGGGCFISAAATSFKLADIQTAAIYSILMVCGVMLPFLKAD